MGSRPVTPSNEVHHVNASVANRPRNTNSRPNSYFASGDLGGAASLNQGQGPHMESSPLAQSLNKHEDSYGLHQNEDAVFDEGHRNMTGGELRRFNSQVSQSQPLMPSKGGTLKKKASLRRSGSIKRSSSRRSSRAGSVRSLALGEKEKYGEGEEFNSAFYQPIPTTGSPTDVLATRFQAWRKVLKDLITYFRDIQKSYEARSKTLTTVSHAIGNITIPGEFLTSGGVGDATYILQDFHKRILNETNRAREMENEVIMQLTGLRSDLQQKIKEIKSLSGDFKNSVDKETESSRRAVRHLQEALGLVDTDPAATAGKGDPFIVKLGVDRQIQRQIEEENYLHRAYLNLESSGRELESIVVGEIHKAYTAYAGILKREADEAFETAEKLREGPLAMAKDHEWEVFVANNDHMVDPRIPIRSFEQITYPGKDHPAASEVRSGMLERKSKYLKNYTPGWYILSPTHLHEFKSADRIYSQAPIMSLLLPEQKLGSHSEAESSSHKFMLKGRQTGGMHRGHTWIFRAESYDTMMAWYGDIKELTEKSGKERDAFVRRSHARSLSGGSMKAHSIGDSSDGGLEEDEADAQPYSSEQSVRGVPPADKAGDRGIDARSDRDDEAGPEVYTYGDEQLDAAGWQASQRPSPGGRFPSDLNVHRGLQAPLSPSSGESSTERDRDAIAAAGALPGSGMPYLPSDDTERQPEHIAVLPGGEKATANQREHDYQEESAAGHGHAKPLQHFSSAPQRQYSQQSQYSQAQPEYAQSSQHSTHPQQESTQSYQQYAQPQQNTAPTPSRFTEDLPHQTQHDYTGSGIAASVGGAAIGATGVYQYVQQPHGQQPRQPETVTDEMDHASAVPAQGTSSPPITIETATTISPTTFTNTNPRSASSSQGDAGSLSTMPTSMGSINYGVESSQQKTTPSAHQAGTVTTAEAVPTSAAASDETSYAQQAGTGMKMTAEALPTAGPDQTQDAPSKPTPLRSVTAGTISDLHIPGEFPKTPKYAQ